MPKINWSKVPDPDGYPTLPDGWYVANLESIKVGETQAGIESWNLKWVVLEPGPVDNPEQPRSNHVVGAWVFDSIFWGGKNPKSATHCLQRAKLIYSRLGAPMAPVQVPDDLIGRNAKIHVTTETYEGKSRNKISFDGYEALTEFQNLGTSEPSTSQKPRGDTSVKDEDISF